MTAMTLAACKDLLPNEELKDHVVQGLSLRAGIRSKSWMLLYRTRNRDVRRPKLGTFPALGIEAAREAARKILAKVAVGEDPAKEWADNRTAATWADLCDRYIQHAKLRKKTWREDERQCDRFIRSQPEGKFLVKAVTQRDIDTLLSDIRARHPRFNLERNQRKRSTDDAPFMANRARAMFGRMFRLALEDFEIRTDGKNPVRKAVRFSERKRRRYATADELRQLSQAMLELSASHPLEMACLWTMFFTGGRVNEIAMAKRSQRKGNMLVLDDHKTADKTGEPRIIHLPDVAVRLLEHFDNREGVARRFKPIKGYLFTGRPMRRTWLRLCKAIGVPDLQMRDARRTFASVGLSHVKLSLDQIGGLLGHANPKTTKVYAHLITETASTLANATGEQMAALMGLPSELVQQPQALLPAPPLPKARPALKVRTKSRLPVQLEDLL